MCQFGQEYLQLYIDGELDPLEKLIVEEHLLVCPPCRQVLNQFKIIDWELHNRDVVIPQKLTTLRHEVIASYTAKNKTTASFGIKELYQIQHQVLKNSVAFMQFLPYSKVVEKTGKLIKRNLLHRWRFSWDHFFSFY